MIKKIMGVTLGAVLAVSAVSGAILTTSAAAGKGTEPAAPAAPVQTETQTAAEPDPNTDNELGAYLFVHFTGSEQNADDEQIYFSVSQDGGKWKTLNEGTPILRNDKGTRGVRDPHIVRSPDGSKFYLIATDLSIYNIHGDWGGSQTNGSKNIVVWESDDLVNWSEPWLSEIARENATCAWAPESIWDEEREAYMVYWASKTEEDWVHRVYRCYTEDFKTFTEPEVYIESRGSRIDTTFIKEGDTYYRFTKDEEKTYVYMEKSKSLSGEFEAVATYSINGASHTRYTGYEGPTVFKLNDADEWCLLLDHYGTGAGYEPFFTDNIAKGRFVAGAAFDFGDVKFRHGTVLPITNAEYRALTAAYGDQDGELVFALDFEDNLDGTGTLAETVHATAQGAPAYEDGALEGSKAIHLTANNYVSIDGSVLKGKESFTISFYAKITGDLATSWLYFAAANDNDQVWQNEKYIGGLWKNGGGLEFERYNSNNIGRPAAAGATVAAGTWAHFVIVYYQNRTTLYVNGEMKQSVSSSVNIAEMLGETPVFYLGRANWPGPEFADAYLDTFKIHDYALSAEKALALYKSDAGIQ